MSKLLVLRNIITKVKLVSSLPIHNHFYFSFQTQHFSILTETGKNESSLQRTSFTINYLINSCGLSPEMALKASKYLNFKVAKKPDSVLAFLKDHGFNDAQIIKIVNYAPQVLSYNDEKTLLPKFEFLKSKGYSDSDIVVMVSRFPRILLRSVENNLVPSFSFLMNFFEPEELNEFKHCDFLLFGFDKRSIANIGILKEAGVPSRNVAFLLVNYPRVLKSPPDKSRQNVDKLKKMGFDPLRITFLVAVKVLKFLTSYQWDKKREVYKKWGWSEKDIDAAFLYYPSCMSLTEGKINSVMEFWVNEMGWESSYLVTIPTILAMSLENRIIPRCKVYQALLSKGFKKPCGISLSTCLTINERKFLQKIVDRHEEEATELLKLYNEKVCKMIKA